MQIAQQQAAIAHQQQLLGLNGMQAPPPPNPNFPGYNYGQYDPALYQYNYNVTNVDPTQYSF